ncbi:DUF4852 domain-containing protein [Sulfurimonas sp. SAG-AH-194-C20]|nr:DUF4852 domain-containing protein [Sulfurimonas sp. SAG-AH-194-C20]MDF1879251.1 DUF4852 domain-containing protein [Sulfurimonas sp. SAG-AH-194-C20]
MKKIVVAGMLSIAVSLFADVNLNDEKTCDKIALFGLQNTLSKVDKAAAGRWYLLQGQQSKYRDVKNDEFELDGAIEEAYSTFEKTVQDSENYVGQTGVLRLGSSFKKYDFKKQSFPISLMEPSSYIEFAGDVFAGWRNSIVLTFDNINPKNTHLPMVKADAKAFMKSRKHKNGRVNRNLTAKYTYTIKKVSTPTKNIASCEENFYNCDDLSKVSVVGHITKLEILDKDEKVLHTYSDYK